MILVENLQLNISMKQFNRKVESLKPMILEAVSCMVLCAHIDFTLMRGYDTR